MFFFFGGGWGGDVGLGVEWSGFKGFTAFRVGLSFSGFGPESFRDFRVA